MSYFHCRKGDPHEDCNGYVGPLDDYTCRCPCHKYDERGVLIAPKRQSAATDSAAETQTTV